MSNIRCCVCDLDGTLLNSQNKINPEDRDALLKFQENGGYVVIATGRIDLQFFEYVSTLSIRGPIITCNGGYIKDTRTNEALHMTTFDPCDIRELVSFCREKHHDYMLYLSDYVYYPSWSRRVEFYRSYNRGALPEHRVPLRCIDEAADELLFSRAIKLLVIGSPELREEINVKFNASGKFTSVMSGTDLIDIMPGHTTKGEGVRLISQMLDIPLSDIAVFGDSPNDASMFRVAGHRIAMGNAVDEVKKLATYVTLKNDECGISHALKHLGAI